MAVVGWFKGVGETGFGWSSSAEEVTEGLDLTGTTVLVTGCNSGIGLETARVVALRGGRVLGAARTEAKARDALAGFAGSDHAPVPCELSEPASVRAAVEQVKALDAPIDAVICNAGIMALPDLTLQHGIEAQLFTNHVGHFLLVTGLLDALAPAGRVVMVSSSAHRRAPPGGIEFDNLDGANGYRPFVAYGQSKLANLLFANALAKRFEGSQRTANAVHPGVIATNLVRHFPSVVQTVFPYVAPLFTKTPGQGAATQLYVAVHPDVRANGAFWEDCNIATPSRAAQDAALAERLWRTTEELVSTL